MNESIALIPGAQTIGTAIPVGFMLYWTSTEVIAADDFPSMAISMTTTNGQMPVATSTSRIPSIVRVPSWHSNSK